MDPEKQKSTTSKMSLTNKKSTTSKMSVTKNKPNISEISLTKKKSTTSKISVTNKAYSGKITPKKEQSAKSLKQAKPEAKSVKIRNYLPEGVLLLKMKVPSILRPNPNWEEDLANSTIIDDKMMERIKTYNQLEKKEVKKPCTCNVERPSGLAPWIKMNDGRMIPSFGIGTWPGFTKTKDKRVRSSEVTKAVENAIDVGYRHIDTAFIYNTEKQVGIAINKKINEGVVRRKDLFITTKLWNDKHRKNDVITALKLSLKKMKLKYVDLYLMHWPIALDAQGNLSDVDYLETWHGMIEAQARNLTRSIGVSNFNEAQLYRIMTCSYVKPAVLQIEFNLNLQQPKLLSFCRQYDILVTGFTPFGCVFDDVEGAPPPRLDDPYLNTLAAKYRKTVAQIILRYIVELGVVPIAKWVTKDHMEENLKIYNFHFTQQERDKLKKFDKNYRTIPVEHWSDAPDYPF